MKSLDDLFLSTLKDILSAEKQILKALPRMAKKADSKDLAKAFETHVKETEGQVDRLEKIFAMLDKKATAKTCEAIKGLVEEGKEVMSEAKDADTRDAGMIGAAQAIEHYEIARYGTMVAWAKQLGMNDAARLLQQTLDEEYKTDRLLSQLAEKQLNRQAAA